MSGQSSPLALASYFGAGLLFAVGLVFAGMTQPAKVVAFLDIFGDWDPSLAFVMGGGIAAHFATYRFILKRESPVFAARFGIPTRRDITPRLIGGAALFGVGWGLAGLCPGPGIVSAGAGTTHGVVFFISLLAGMGLFHWVDHALQNRKAADADAAGAPAPAPAGEGVAAR